MVNSAYNSNYGPDAFPQGIHATMTFTGDCTVQTVYTLFRAIFQHIPGASMFRLKTENAHLALLSGESRVMAHH